MPIINLTTDLKSLQYGMDRPGGGSSGQPFLFTGFENINLTPPTIDNPSGIGQNFLDIPTIINAPASVIYSNNGAPGTFFNPTFTVFKGNGIDIASPIIKTLNTTIEGVTNVIDTTANGIINTFDTTRNSNYPDFLLRKNRFNIAHSFADVVRVSKFFTTPAGIFFILKQNILERQNPKLVNRDRLYNPLNTVVQVGINSYGNHLNKSDIDPFQDSYYTGGTYGYFYSTRGLGEYPIFQTLSTGDIENRLTIAYTAKIANQEDLGELTINPFGISSGPDNQNILLSYPGGPGSVLGIGDTIIRIQNPTRPIKSINEEGKFIPTFYGPDILPTDPLYLTPNPFYGFKIGWTYGRLFNKGASAELLDSLLDGTESTRKKYRDQIFSLGVDKTTYLNRDTNYINRKSPNVAYNNYINHTSSIAYISSSNINDATTYLVPTVSNEFGSNINWETELTYKYAHASYKYYSILNSVYVSPTTRNTAITALDISGTSYFKDTPGATNVKQAVLGQRNNKDNNQYVFSYDQTINQSSKSNKTTGLSSIVDFRKTIVEKSKDAKTSLPNTDYSTFNRETTYKTSTTNYRGNYNGTAYVLDPNTGVNSDVNSLSSEDLIKFQFDIITYGGTSSTKVFRAYLEDWSDSFKADWNGVKYMGRGEELYKYGGFSRNGSISFNVPVLSAQDQSNIYSRLNGLINAVAPEYTSGAGLTGLLTGAVVKITMGDYWKNMPILVDSINYAPISDMGWDIGRDINGNVGKGSKSHNDQLPKGIKVDMSFKIIHNTAPRNGISFIN